MLELVLPFRCNKICCYYLMVDHDTSQNEFGFMSFLFKKSTKQGNRDWRNMQIKKKQFKREKNSVIDIAVLISFLLLALAGTNFFSGWFFWPKNLSRKRQHCLPACYWAGWLLALGPHQGARTAGVVAHPRAAVLHALSTCVIETSPRDSYSFCVLNQMVFQFMDALTGYRKIFTI